MQKLTAVNLEFGWKQNIQINLNSNCAFTTVLCFFNIKLKFV